MYNSHRKQLVHNLLKSIETGDPSGVQVVNEAQYIQHNPQTAEGGIGLAELFARLAKTNPRVEILRLFEDGDIVFGHVVYDFSSVRVGFEAFRFDGPQIVEHWDNIQTLHEGMTVGTTAAEDHAHTEQNRDLIRALCTSLASTDANSAARALDDIVDHSPHGNFSQKLQHAQYTTTHRILAEGSFVLAVHEGTLRGTPTSFYDLFRVQHGVIVEHWDTTESIPPRHEWKNDNGKF